MWRGPRRGTGGSGESVMLVVVVVEKVVVLVVVGKQETAGMYEILLAIFRLLHYTVKHYILFNAITYLRDGGK